MSKMFTPSHEMPREVERPDYTRVLEIYRCNSQADWVILGDPRNLIFDEDKHSCDQMGCGTSHVLVRGETHQSVLRQAMELSL